MLFSARISLLFVTCAIFFAAPGAALPTYREGIPDQVGESESSMNRLTMHPSSFELESIPETHSFPLKGSAEKPDSVTRTQSTAHSITPILVRPSSLLTSLTSKTLTSESSDIFTIIDIPADSSAQPTQSEIITTSVSSSRSSGPAIYDTNDTILRIYDGCVVA